MPKDFTGSREQVRTETELQRLRPPRTVVTTVLANQTVSDDVEEAAGADAAPLIAAGKRLEKVVHRLYLVRSLVSGFEHMLQDAGNNISAQDMLAGTRSAVDVLIKFAETGE